MTSPLTEEENARCWEYVMNYSLGQIHLNKGSEMNQKCSSHINSKESFINYVEDKRRSIRDSKKDNKKPMDS
jgi:hypothetical protein